MEQIWNRLKKIERGDFMASAKNRVIAGDYTGNLVNGSFGIVSIAVGFKASNSITLNPSTVEAYELITDEHRKSAASGVARGLVGGWIVCEKQRNLSGGDQVQRW